MLKPMLIKNRAINIYCYTHSHPQVESPTNKPIYIYIKEKAPRYCRPLTTKNYQNMESKLRDFGRFPA